MRIRIYYSICLLFLAVSLFGQGQKPRNFPEKTTAGDNDAIYTQEDGADKKIKFSNARKYFLPLVNPIELGSPPAASGNTLQLGQFVTVADTIWYIDGAGNSVRLFNPGVDTEYIDAQLAFDSDRAILRSPGPGDVIGGSTIQDFLNYYYFVPPTITLNLTPSTTFYQFGTSNSITLSGSTSNPGAATLSGGVLSKTSPTSGTVNSFGSSTTYSQAITFAPQEAGSADYTQPAYSFRASQAWSAGSESGTAQSTTRSIKAGYPVLWGVSAIDLHSTGDPYSILTKLVEDQGDKTVVFNGTDVYLYYCVPMYWSDTNLSSIKDPNNLEALTAFTPQVVSVTSSGLVNNWTTNYRIYKLDNLTSASNASYTFIR